MTSCSYSPTRKYVQYTAIIVTVIAVVMALLTLPIVQWGWVLVLFLLIAPMFYCSVTAFFPKIYHYYSPIKIQPMGFTIMDNAIKGKKHKIAFEDFQWSDIEELKLDTTLHQLEISMKNKRVYSFEGNQHNYFIFLNKAPKQLTKDYATYIETIEKDLTFCAVCGNKSLWEGTCQSCSVNVYNSDVMEYKTYEEYVKQEQLYLFEVDESDESVDWSIRLDEHFEQNPNWELLVTKEEVLEHSKYLWED